MTVNKCLKTHKNTKQRRYDDYYKIRLQDANINLKTPRMLKLKS
jgi:hypothetical protein